MADAKGFNERLAEHKYHWRLGCGIYCFAIVLAVLVYLSVGTLLSMARIRYSGMAALALAVLIAGAVQKGLKSAFGFQPSKASSRSLRADFRENLTIQLPGASGDARPPKIDEGNPYRD